MYFRFPLLLLLIVAGLVGIIILKDHLDEGVSAANKAVPVKTPSEPTSAVREDIPDTHFAALQSITSSDLRRHVVFLADDVLQGRDTGSRGARIAALYISSQFDKFGLRPVGENGSYYQTVYLNEKKISADSEFKIEIDGEMVPLKYKVDFLVVTPPNQSGMEVTRDLIFTAFGIQASEYDYDDFKNLDVKGKATIYVSGEPPSDDEKYFRGNKASQYSNGSAKRRTAKKNGADAAIGVVLPELFEQISWAGIQNFYTRSKISLRNDAATEGEDFAAIILHPDAGELLFAGTGRDFADIKKAAMDGTIQPFEMSKKIQMKLIVENNQIEDSNVAGFLEGSDAELKSEVIVFTAHYDHVGIGTPVKGDSIYNGAADNASGTSGLMELAEAFSLLPERPKRSMLFLAVTAEEKGLLGSKFYVKNPIFPLAKTVANFNLDMIGIGDTTGVVVYGIERSTLGDMITKAVQEVGLEIIPDELPEQRIFYRSDHFSFVKQGIPSIMPGFGIRREWFANFNKFYHQPSDDANLFYFDFGYMKKSVQAIFLAGLWVANAEKSPTWTPGDEFEHAREAKQE